MAKSQRAFKHGEKLSDIELANLCLGDEPYVARDILADIQQLARAVHRFDYLINTPHTDEFFEATRLEAAHQQTRWGVDHDDGKEPPDWFWLLGYLSGKALAAFLKGDRDKGLHHIISSSAVLLNWHRHATGEITRMRPGIQPPKGETHGSKR